MFYILMILISLYLVILSMQMFTSLGWVSALVLALVALLAGGLAAKQLVK